MHFHGVPSGQSDQQAVGSPVPKSYPDSSRLAQHAMVLGPSGSVIPDTHLSPKPPRFGDSAIQWCLSQGSGQSKHSSFAPRAKTIKEHGFLAQWRYTLMLLRDAQPEQSMRQSGTFMLDGVRQVRWTSNRPIPNKKQIFSCLFFRRKIFSLVQSMVIGQPLQTN